MLGGGGDAGLLWCCRRGVFLRGAASHSPPEHKDITSHHVTESSHHTNKGQPLTQTLIHWLGLSDKINGIVECDLIHITNTQQSPLIIFVFK